MADSDILDDIPTTEGRTLTEIDEAIASAVYPVLAKIAQSRPERTITYKEMLAEASLPFQGQPHPVHNQEPKYVGRRLEALRRHTQAYKYPDLSCLVVNASDDGNPVPDMAARQALAWEFDWSTVKQEFLVELGIDPATGMARLRRTREEAKNVMTAYGRDHGRGLHPRMREQREEIITALIRGEDPADVFTAIDSRLRELDPPVRA